MNKKDKLKILALYLHRRRNLMKAKLTALMLALLNTERTLSTLINMRTYQFRVDPRLLLSANNSESEASNSVNNSPFWESDVPKMSDNEFKHNFRVTKKTFNKICQKVKIMEKQDFISEPSIPHKKKVAIALYALGTAFKYTTVAQLFKVELSTVAEIVTKFCIIVCDTFDEYISSYPPTTEEIKRVVSGFESHGFPQCFGAVGTYHIKIEPRMEETIDYYSYKGFPAIILLASCDHRSQFTYLNIGSPGSSKDLTVFDNSSLKRFHEKSRIFLNNSKTLNNVDVPVLLIGNADFRLTKFMMRPYPSKDNQPKIEKMFNYKLNKCHQVIENAFTELKTRFRKLDKGLEMTPESYSSIVKACCLLNNFLKTEQDDMTELYTIENADSGIQNQPSNTRFGEDNEAAKDIRNAIALGFEFNGVSCSGDNNEPTFMMRGNENEDVGSADESGSHFFKDELVLDSS